MPRKIVLIGGDGGFSGVPRHIKHLVTACADQADFLVLSDRNKGGYNFLGGLGVRHAEVDGLATALSPLRCLAAMRRLARIIACEQPDLVWAHSRMGVVLVRMMILAGILDPGVRVAVTYHGLPFEQGHRAGFGALSARIERLALCRRRAQALIFLSEAARDHFIATVGAEVCGQHTLLVQPNCSDLGPVIVSGRRDPLRRIVMTGRDGWQKNPERALRIFAALPGNYHLTFCGPGTAAQAFRNRARRILGPGKIRRVSFAGALQDVRPLLASADCYLLTSRYEGAPIGAIEAFEAGLPVALADIAGTQDILSRHPYHVALSGDHQAEDPTEDALRIVGLVEGYLPRRLALSSVIRDCWKASYSFPVWAVSMREHLDRICPKPDPQGPELSDRTGIICLADATRRRSKQPGAHVPGIVRE